MKVPTFKRTFSYDEFVAWRELLEDYILMKGFDDPEKKLATMRVIGGMELVELLKNLPEYEQNVGLHVSLIANDAFMIALNQLEEYFDQFQNVHLEQATFHKLTQMEGERIKDFAQRLRKHARKCGFANAEEEVFNRLIVKTRDEKLKYRFYTGKLKQLEKALEEGMINEVIKKQLAPDVPINAVTTEKKSKDMFKRDEAQSRQSKRTLVCYACQGEGHFAVNCPLKARKVCYGCGSKDHVIRNCPVAKARNSGSYGRSDEPSAKRPRVQGVNYVKEETGGEMVNFLNGEKDIDGRIGGVKTSSLEST